MPKSKLKGKKVKPQKDKTRKPIDQKLVAKIATYMDQFGVDVFPDDIQQHKPQTLTVPHRKGVNTDLAISKPKKGLIEIHDVVTRRLNDLGVKASQLTPEVLAEARRRLHDAEEQMRNRLAKLGGRLNNKRLYLDASGEVTTINPHEVKIVEVKATRPKMPPAQPKQEPEPVSRKVKLKGGDDKPKAVQNIQGGKTRQTLMGFTVTGVLKWMGARGYTPEQATKLLKSKGIDSPQSTIVTALRDGKSPKYSKGMADITSAQAKEIRGTVGEPTGDKAKPEKTGAKPTKVQAVKVKLKGGKKKAPIKSKAKKTKSRRK